MRVSNIIHRWLAFASEGQPGRGFGLLSAAAAIGLAGCGALGSGSGTLAVRMVNAVPGTGNLDIVAAGTTFVSSLPYNGITTYGFINKGDNSLVGNGAGTSTAVVPSHTITVQKGVYTIAAAGIPGNTVMGPMFFAIPDDNSLPPRGQIRVRVINLSPDSGPVDVTIGSQTVATGAAYPTSSVAATSGAYTIVNPTSVMNTGTKDYTIGVHPSGGTTIIASKTVPSLTGDHVFTFFVEGLQSNNTIVVVPQEDT